MVSYATPAGTITLDGNIDDWHEVSWLRPLYDPDPGDFFADLPLYATTSDTHFVFALNASPSTLGWQSLRPKLWFDTDLDASTGSKFYGVYGGVNVQVPRPYQMAEGIDFEVRFVDRLPQLFTGDGAPVSADIQYSESANVIEFSVERSAFGASTEAMRVQLPLYDGNYGGYHFTPPSVYFGASGDIALDGSSGDWTAADRLDSPANGVEGFAVWGKATENAFVFAIQSPIGIGKDSTIWLNTDNDTSTGYQIWGWAGGAEYNVNFDAAGTPRLYGIDQINDLGFAFSQDRTFVELIVPKELIDAPAQVNALLDINDLTFLPTLYAETQYEIGGTDNDIILDGSSGDWTAADRLDSSANGVDGFAVWGKATENAFVFAIQSPIAIGKDSTIWLNTDDDASTGYQIWGWAGGAEYNVNFDAAGTPRLYGIDQVSDLAFAYSEDRKFVELFVPKELIDSPAQVNALLDINDLTFLPTLYAETQYEIVDPYSDLMLA